MPTYAIQKDLPPPPPRASMAPTMRSAYSDEYTDTQPGTHAADVPALNTKASYHPSYHAHPRQQINDYGPQVRQSRLPLFKQVRTMLHRPPPLLTPGNAKWDEYTGELSVSGKPANVHPSTYEAALKATRRQSPERPKGKSQRNLSPVSVLHDHEIHTTRAIQVSRYSMENDVSPISPSTTHSPTSIMHDREPDEESEFIPEMMPEPLSPNVQRAPLALATPTSNKQITRKPVSRRVSTAENFPPPSPPQLSPSSEPNDTDGDFIEGRKSEDNVNSHFSWTTYAPTIAAGRPSTETQANRLSKFLSTVPERKEVPRSRFSWSTINTNVTHQDRPPSPSSPPPPVPIKISGPPVQSILSRQRPVKRIEKEEWTPPPRKSSRQEDVSPMDSLTPTSAIAVRPPPFAKDAASPISRSHSPAAPTTDDGRPKRKALPPPPTEPEDANRTHLESLLAEERSLALQRRNVEKGIRELEKIEKASPMDVPFSTVRDAKKRLGEYRARMSEIVLEEREVGIAVTRARRKEGEENGFDSGSAIWIRRVTS